MSDTKMHIHQKGQTRRLEDYDNLPYRYFHKEVWESHNRHYRWSEYQDSKDNLYIDVYALEHDCNYKVYDTDCNTAMHYHARRSEIREILANEVLLARVSPMASSRIDN